LDIKEIKQIVDLMKRSSLTEFELQEQDFKLRICRSSGETVTMVQPAAPVAVAQPAVAPQAAAAAPAAPSERVDDPSKWIKSPMVGTFYAAPSPDSDAFVKVGDKVAESTVVCILEAMKVMNEITAERSGTIAEIMVENGDSVEYGQPLFRLK
jgi:acetyl-CoA carboxylase biotin carboxyl carrier protein